MSAESGGAKAALARLEKSPRVRAAVFFAILVLIAGTVGLLNLHTPLQMDDYDYSVSWATGQPISGLADVIASQAAHYKIWGGRSVVHALAQLFLWLGKGIFNIANTAMYLVLLLEVYLLAKPKDVHFSWMLLLLAHTLLFFALPFFGTVFLWLDGACNYLWGTALAILPLVMYKSRREGGFWSKRFAGPLTVLLSFLAGWTNENTACGVWGVMFLLLCCDLYKKRKADPWQWAALLAEAAGAAVMILAPGNFARASSYTYDSFLLEILKRLFIIGFYTALYTVSFFVIGGISLWLGRKHRSAQRTFWAVMLLAGGMISALAMVASPELSDRALTGTVILTMAAALSLMADLKIDRLVFLPIFVLVLAVGSVQAVSAVKAHEAAWNRQLVRIEEAKVEGDTRVQVESVPSQSRFTMNISLSGDPAQWPNSTLGKYFGIEIEGL